MKRQAKLFSLIILVCCKSPPLIESVDLNIFVKDLSGEPIPEATVYLKQTSIGKTSKEGKLQTGLSGIEGQQFAVSVDCPDGYKTLPSSSSSVVFRKLLKPEGNNMLVIPLTATLTCSAITQKFVLVVKTDPPLEIPISTQGRVVDKISPEGVAQMLLSGQIGEEIEIVLNTESVPEVVPKSPTRRIVIPQDPQILVFEQSFKIQKKKQRKKPRRQLGPRRI